MARAGEGRPFVATNEHDAINAAQRFTKLIATPAATGLKLRFDGFDAYDVEPNEPPDVFAGRPVVVVGKYRKRPSGTTTVEGVTGTGRFAQEVRVSDVAPDKRHEALAWIWAREQIARLSDLHAITSDDATAKQITQLGLRYGLMTAFTSFVAVDSLRRQQGKARTIVQPLPMPASVENSAVGGMAYGAFGSGSGFGAGSGGLGVGTMGSAGRGVGTTKITPGRTIVEGSLSRERISGSDVGSDAALRQLRRQTASFNRCYAEALESNPTVQGRLVHKIRIGKNGRVLSVDVVKDELGDEALTKCVTSVILRLRVTPPADELEVSFPLVLRPAQ